MKNPKFQIYTGKDGQFYFRLYARNGEIILSSEGYTSKSNCQNGISSVKETRRMTSATGEKQRLMVSFILCLLPPMARLSVSVRCTPLLDGVTMASGQSRGRRMRL